MCLALPGRLEDAEVDEGLRMGRVDFGGVRKRVCLELVPEAEPGDWVLVHVGFALRTVDERAAAEAREALGSAPAPPDDEGGASAPPDQAGGAP